MATPFLQEPTLRAGDARVDEDSELAVPSCQERGGDDSCAKRFLQGVSAHREPLASWACGWVFVLLAFWLSVACYQHVGAGGQLGSNAMQTLQEIAGDGKGRRWPSKKGVDELKSRIDQIALEYPSRVEIMHQNVPVTKDTVHGPFDRTDCQSIVTDSCVSDWGKKKGSTRFTALGCATECPYDESKPEGRRCCGTEEWTNGRPPLPAFAGISKTHLLDERMAYGRMLYNLVFRIKGQGSGEFDDSSAILVSAHYDSPGKDKPGVADDLAGVAVSLEVARTLAAGDPLPRDVIFALVAAEEEGCVGSVIFRQYHPWRAKPAFVVNLEGKGKANSKEWLVRSTSSYGAHAYAKFAPRPAGFSFAEWLMGSMRDSFTDLDIYRRSGYHGIDLIYVHDSYVYHTADDDVSTASEAGLEHEGTNVLGIVRGVAQDPNFPAPMTTKTDPLVGVWNNELLSGPPIVSRTIFTGLFDTWMWIADEHVARGCLAGTVAFSLLASPAAAWCLRARGHLGSLPLGGLLCGVFGDYLFFLLALFLGTFFAGLNGAILSSRDLRTWYTWPTARILFFGVAGVLPSLLVELTRRCCGRRPGCLQRLFFWTADHPSDHVAVLGAFLLQGAVLLVMIAAVPHLWFYTFWNVLLLPFGLAVEAAVLAVIARRQHAAGGAKDAEGVKASPSTVAAHGHQGRIGSTFSLREDAGGSPLSSKGDVELACAPVSHGDRGTAGSTNADDAESAGSSPASRDGDVELAHPAPSSFRGAGAGPALSDEPAAKGLPAEDRDSWRRWSPELLAVLARELFTVCLPLFLTMPQMYNMLYVFAYIQDGRGLALVNGVVVGVSCSILALAFAPAARRLPTAALKYVAAAVVAAWVVLLGVCFGLPTNTSLKDYN